MRFYVLSSSGAIVNVGPDPTNYVSKPVFGDCKVHLSFMLPEGGNSGVYLMGRYEVQLLDSAGKDALSMGDCGGIYRGEHWPGRAPDFNAFREAGLWHELDVEFQAPRFDAQGQKTENARFLRVRIDDTLLQENVEVPEPTLAALASDEAALGPLMLQGDHTQVAYADVRVFPKLPRTEPEGWTPLWNGEDLEGWRVSTAEPAGADADGGAWKAEDGVIIGSGKTSHLFSPRDDYQDFELRGRFKISDGGNSGLYFRTTYGPGWPDGYEAQINATMSDPSHRCRPGRPRTTRAERRPGLPGRRVMRFYVLSSSACCASSSRPSSRAWTKDRAAGYRLRAPRALPPSMRVHFSPCPEHPQRILAMCSATRGRVGACASAGSSALSS